METLIHTSEGQLVSDDPFLTLVKEGIWHGANDHPFIITESIEKTRAETSPKNKWAECRHLGKSSNGDYLYCFLHSWNFEWKN